MDISLVTSVLKDALALYHKPEIFNTDQGSQYTAKAHIEILKKHGIKISMDGKGRATDNICIERFWRSIKYEEIYLNEYKNIKSLNRAIKKYINFYNQKRLHSTLENGVHYNFRDIFSHLLKSFKTILTIITLVFCKVIIIFISS